MRKRLARRTRKKMARMAGLALALSALCLSLGIEAMRSGRRAFLQNSTTETATLLAGQVRGDLDHLIRSVTEIAEGRLSKLSEGDAPPEADLGMDRDFLDISIWGRPEGSVKPKRLSQYLNSRYVNPAQDALLRAQTTENIEADLIAAAFRGQVVVTLAMTVDPGSVALFAMPLQGSKSDQVVVTHVALSRFQRAFRFDGLTRAVLVNGDGMVLAHSGYKLQDTRESLASHPLVRALRGDALVSGGGQLDYTDSKGIENIGGYRRINVGKLAVITSIPEPEAGLEISGFLGRSLFWAALIPALALALGAVGAWPRSPWLRAMARFRSLVRAGLRSLSGALGEVRLRGSRKLSRARKESEPEPRPVQASARREEPVLTTFIEKKPREPEAAPQPVTATVTSGPVSSADIQILDLGAVTPAPAAGPASSSAPVPAGESPQHKIAMILHGSVTRITQVLEAQGPEAAMTALNEFLNHAGRQVKDSGGQFERDSGSSFVAVWEDPSRAIHSALQLRKDFIHYNGLRKNDGDKPLSLGMGLESGLVLLGSGADGSGGRFSVIGDTLACARKLDQLSATAGTDLLLSREVWEMVHERFIGTRKGEAKLTPSSGLREYFSVDGYREATGAEVHVPSSYAVLGGAAAPVESALTNPHLVMPQSETRWLVNNGSQIVGPLTAQEIALRLFTQDLDFDCECWLEGTGKPSKISEAGIFTGSDDEDAGLWVYDGSTMHGPMSFGFFKIALNRGAIPAAWHICEKSTVYGWKTVGTWAPIAPHIQISQAAPVPMTESVPMPASAPEPVEEVQVAEEIPLMDSAPAAVLEQDQPVTETGGEEAPAISESLTSDLDSSGPDDEDWGSGSGSGPTWAA